MNPVYYMDLETKHGVSLEDKFRGLLAKAGLKKLVAKDDLVAIKIHAGEEGNLGYTNHNYARVTAEEITRLGGKPFLTDTNTLYSGGRHNGVDHYKTATRHGFALLNTGAPFIVADGIRGTDYEEVKSPGTHFTSIKMASAIFRADKMIVLSHFKGHIEAGFGGTIKSLGMGCAPAAGKADQHSSSKPAVTISKCTGCKHCFRVCPVQAITMESHKAKINYDICIGCGQCVASCNYDAMGVDWNAHGDQFCGRVCEYAAAVYQRFAGKALFCNFAMDITPDCDCWGYNEPRMVGDVGIFASEQPAAVDKASLDLVNKSIPNPQSRFYDEINGKKDIFEAQRKGHSSAKWFECCEKLGMKSEYELVKV